MKQTRWCTRCLRQGSERSLRTVWVVAPATGFIVTGLIPAISDLDGNNGLNIVMAVVHALSAPVSMLMLMVMETVQLSFGEDVLFNPTGRPRGKAAQLFGREFTRGQIVRKWVCIFAWLSGVIFIGCQGYLVLVNPKNENKALGLLSFFTEVFGILGAFVLPALAGFEYLYKEEEGSVIAQATTMVKRHFAKKGGQTKSVMWGR